MISLKQRKEQGFTIIELLIVIVVIGILALLVVTTYSGIQQKARNTKRADDIGAVQRQLEVYYQNVGNYPTLAQVNSSSWRSTNLKTLPAEALVDPKQSCDATDSAAACVASSPTANKYSYEPKKSDGTACTTDTDCAQYTLTGTYEGTVNGKSTIVKTGTSN